MERDKSKDGKFLQRFIPARVVFVFLAFFGFNLVYAFKVVLSMSIIAMVTKSNTTHDEMKNITGTICHESGKHDDTPFPGHKFNDWDSQVQSQVLGSFFYGYIITQIPAGIIATRYGGKWIFGSCIFIAAILSILGPISAKIDYRLFIVTRIVQGLAEGVVFPTMNQMISQWIPLMERSRGTTVIFTGSMIGTVVTLPITAILSKTHFMGSWEATFYLLGIAGVIWFILWAFLVSESPELHPFISTKEKNYILENGGGLKIKGKISIPYREMFTSIHVYAMILTHFGQNWGFLTVLNLMPTYMNSVLKMNINENIIISGLPYLGQAIWGWAASFVTDKLRQSGRFSITTLRKANSVIAYIPPAICLALVPLFQCNTTMAAVLLILTVTLNGSCHCGINSTHVDVAPHHAGTLMGITNSIGNIPGFLATIVAAQFTKHGQTVENWSYVFYLSAGVFVLTTFVYCLFATAEEQPWGRRQEEQTIKPEIISTKTRPIIAK